MIKEKKILALIPARGGSKGIPGKNLKKLGGKSLIEIALESAKDSIFIDELIVSTDDKEIFNISKELGFEPPFLRPSEFAEDTSSSASVVNHALEFFKKSSIFFDICVLLQPTNPLRTTKMIDDSIKILSKSNADSVVSVTDVGGNHPYRMYKLEKNYLKPIIKNDNPQLARQLLPKIFIRSGDIYCCNSNVPFKYGDLIGAKSIPYEIESGKTVNIDNYNDLYLAEKLFVSQKNEMPNL